MRSDSVRGHSGSSWQSPAFLTQLTSNCPHFTSSWPPSVKHHPEPRKESLPASCVTEASRAGSWKICD